MVLLVVDQWMQYTYIYDIEIHSNNIETQKYKTISHNLLLF